MAVKRKKKTAAVQPAAVPAEKPAVPMWPKVYIGPVKRGGYLTTLKVFSNGFTQQVQDLIRQYPAICNLFVPTSELRTALTEVKKKGTLLNHFYNQTLLKIEGGLNV